MRNELEYTIEYFEKGKDYSKRILISRINMEISHAYEALIKEHNAYAEVQADIQDEIAKIAAISVERGTGLVEKFKLASPSRDKIKELKKRAASFGSVETIEKRFKLIKMIFEVNGIEDEKLNDINFWKKNVDTQEPWNFIFACMTKDNEEDTKKKE